MSEHRPTTRLASERQEAIAALARMYGVVRVSELAERYAVSHVTIRRDIAVLVERGLVTRIHGGARSTIGMAHATEHEDQTRIGVILPAARYYFRELFEGVKEAAQRSGIAVVLAVSEYDESEERRLIERMLRANVAGILLATAAGRPDARWVHECPVPVVLVERAAPTCEFVRSDHEEGAKLGVEHLIARGHRRIVLAACTTTPTAAPLAAGYRAGLEAAGVEVLEPFVLPHEGTSLSERNTRLEALLLACRDRGVTAVILHPEGFALPLLEAAKDLGLAVPEDLAVVSYDDELAEFASVPLTAVQPPKRDVGNAAVDLLVRRCTRPSAAMQRVSLLPKLMVRDSS